MKRMVQTKQGKKWITTWETDNDETIYKCLYSDLMARYMHKAPYIKRVTDVNNYDGTRTVTVYYGWDGVVRSRSISTVQA